jgi:hypothetical protein
MGKKNKGQKVKRRKSGGGGLRGAMKGGAFFRRGKEKPQGPPGEISAVPPKAQGITPKSKKVRKKRIRPVRRKKK